MKNKGIFISFEGGEGAGKTTQIKRIVSFLQEKNYDVITTREPGGTPEAEKIRDLLVQRDGGDWTPKSECLMFFAARQIHVERLIKPALNNNKIVITDRFTDSTRAYQSYGHNLDINFIEEVNKTVLGDFEPDLTFIFDLPIDIGLERSLKNNIASSDTREEKEDKFEKLDNKFHENMRQGFLKIAKEHKNRCKLIDATKTMDEVTKDILFHIKEKIND